jgi:hypothetical protein
MSTLPNSASGEAFMRAAQDASGTSLGAVVMAPSNVGPNVHLAGMRGLGALSPAASSYLSLAGATAVGAGIGYAASRGNKRGAAIGAGIQLAIASALNIVTTRGLVSNGTHIVQGLAGLSGLIGAGILLARKRG